ncbi:hypothetical protein HELRODRAFT_188093 [Helobdella robusta]|uniref:Uncharacterized protein n=1 Tax=Helobdella robusta TaxID=6412 RepID=T1FPM3_HELRO|nr:hypothetical protein HELRODRAFT_188093 [Helobdella robusta]ESO13060.1 hypothetical protein HELRODRAFT_188093 [Helobdella robusta]
MAEKIRNEKQADSKHKENKHSGQHQHGKLVPRPDKAIHAKISSISMNMNTSNFSDKKSNDCNISCAPSYSSNITLTRSGYLPSPLRLDNRGTFFDSCNIDNESNSNSNEVFFPSKDHIFLTETIDTTTMSRHRNMNKDIEVDVSTSLVKSPARVIRHHHHQQPQHFFRQNSDSINVTAILPSTIANTTNSSGADLASPNFQNSEIKCSHLEQQRQLDKKIKVPDMKEDPLRKQVKKKGQIVASRYMQPSKGPLKATEKIMPTTTSQQPSSRNISGGLLQRSSSLKKSNLNKAPVQSSQSSINKSFHSSKGNMSPAQQQQHHHKRSQSSKDDNKASGPLQQQRLQQTTTTKKQFFPIPTLNSSSDKQSTTSLNQDGHTDVDGKHNDDDDARSLRHHMKATPTLSDADVTKPHQHKRGLTSSTPNMLHSTMQAKGPDLSSYMHSVGGMDVSSIAPLDQTKQLESAQVTKDLFTSIINQSQALDDKQSKLAKKSYKNGAKNNSSSSSSSLKMASQTKFDINLIYSRYIQYVYLNAMIEQCSQKQFKRAMEELHELWLLAEETSQRKHDLQLELRELERLESTSQAVSILEETLPSISGQIDEFTYMHDKLIKSLDSKRHVMPVSGDVYLPDEKLEDAYYAGLTSELKSVHVSLQEMMRKIGGEPIQLLELKDSAHEMKQITPQFIDESNKCRSAIVEAVDALTEHRFMKIANNNDNNKTSPPKFKLP